MSRAKSTTPPTRYRMLKKKFQAVWLSLKNILETRLEFKPFFGPFMLSYHPSFHKSKAAFMKKDTLLRDT